MLRDRLCSVIEVEGFLGAFGFGFLRRATRGGAWSIGRTSSEDEEEPSSTVFDVSIVISPSSCSSSSSKIDARTLNRDGDGKS